MAADLKSKKRRADAAPVAANTKKARKSGTDTIHKSSKVEKKRKSVSAAPIDESSDEGVTNPNPKKVKKTVTKSRRTNGKAEDVLEETKLELLDEGDLRKKKTKATKEVAAVAYDSADSADEAAGDDAADQTAALLKGFESSSESESGADDGVAIEDIPALPKVRSGKKGAADGDDEFTPGVIYVGRVPHGFYEHQMHAYFSQFGEILHLRLSRNKKTGASRHYAFIEFASMAVAKIVAATMNKYLLFGHILQVRVVPPKQVHPELFKGAGRRFKAVPRNKLERQRLNKGLSRQAWKARIDRENEKRNKKAEQLKAIGYDFEPPRLIDVDAIPIRGNAEGKTEEAVETNEQQAEIEEPKAIEAHKEQDTIEDIVRASKASPGVVEVTEKITVTKPKAPKAEKAVKAKKGKKSKV